MISSEPSLPDSAVPATQAGPLQRRSPVWRLLLPALALGAGIAILLLLPSQPGTGAATGADLAGSPQPIPRTGAPAPDFQVMSLEGKPVSLQDYRGKVVLVNFWATWCIPCRSELPDLSQAYREHQDHGFVVLAVNVKEGEEQVRRFLEEIPVPFPVLMDTDGKITNRFAVTALPTSFFVDADGVIRGVFIGNLNKGAVVKKLEQMAANRVADQATAKSN